MALVRWGRPVDMPPLRDQRACPRSPGIASALQMGVAKPSHPLKRAGIRSRINLCWPGVAGRSRSIPSRPALPPHTGDLTPFPPGVD